MWQAAVVECDELPSAVGGATQPPLVILHFRVRLPCVATLDGGVVVGQELGDLRVSRVIVEAVERVGFANATPLIPHGIRIRRGGEGGECEV